MDDNAELFLLNCYICFEPLKKPKMCPSCSKVACQKCLRIWIEDNRAECPHCRKNTPLSSFAECQRFISDIRYVLQATDQTDKIKQKCKQHKMEMNYFCQDCEQSICSDCGMFGIKHRNHKITHLKKIYQEYKNKILNELVKFDQKIEIFRKNGLQIKFQMQKLLLEHSSRKKFIEQFFFSIIQNLEQQLKQKQQKITQKYQSNTRQIQFLQSFRQNICKQLQISSQQQLIIKSQQLIGYIKSLSNDKQPDMKQIEHKFQTINKIVPEFNTFTYVMKNYHDIEDIIVYSQPYIINGMEWKLKIYPKGNGQGNDTHISVFLQLTQSLKNWNFYEYKIQLINHKNTKNLMIREYSSHFDIGECWGYNQFILISDLNNGFLNEAGDLVFIASFRNPSYSNLVEEQNQYINYLQSKISNVTDNVQENPKNNKATFSKMNELAQLSKQAKENIKKILMSYSEGEESNAEEQVQEVLSRIYSKQQQQKKSRTNFFSKRLKDQNSLENDK